MKKEFSARTTDDSSTKVDGNSVSPTCPKPIVSGSLPSLEDAANVAVRISEEAINPPLSAQEQAFFIAGFQECIKWLRVLSCNDR